MTTKDGGPAFPCNWTESFGGMEWPTQSLGLSLRDYFAGQALPKCISLDRNRQIVSTAQGAARMAYEIADAMLAAREAE